MNNCFYKEVFNYTLEDLIGLITKDSLDSIGVVSLLKNTYSAPNGLEIELSLFEMTLASLYDRKTEGGLVVVNPTNYSKMLQLLFNRFAEHYVLSADEEMSALKLKSAFIKWRRKFIGILTATKDKYNSLLDIYSDNLSKLMDGIKTTTEDSGENSSQNAHSGDSTRQTAIQGVKSDDYDVDNTEKELINDTPTTTEVVSTIEADQFVTGLKKKTGHVDNVGTSTESNNMSENGTDRAVDTASGSHDNTITTENDTYTKMARIDEVQKLFQNTLISWTNEFAGLFIEERNL